MKQQWFRRTAVWTGRSLTALLLVAVLLLGFATTTRDAGRMRAFADAVRHWQHDPEFRAVHREYVDLGSDAVRTRVAGVETGDAILFLRSLPGLPEHLKVNPTSLEHYKSFTEGALGAYLHLSAEQGLSTAFDLLQKLGRSATLNDAEIVYFIGSFKLHEATIADAGALKSVRMLIGDLELSRGFVVTGQVVEKMTARAMNLAAKLGYPTELGKMSPEQQHDIWQRLDAEIKQDDYELWRSKQVCDWLSGVWAQGYGPMYSDVIGPVLTIRMVCRIGGPLVMVAWAGLVLRRRQRLVAPVVESSESIINQVV